MAAFNKFNAVAANPWNGVYNLASDVLKVMLTNTVPVATNAIYTDITEIANGLGYTTGGATVTVSSSTQTAGLWKLLGSCANPTWTSTGAFATFRYIVLYDSTPANKNLLGWWDYGSPVTLTSTQTFFVSFDGTNGILQMS
jgi:hypothetical protein